MNVSLSLWSLSVSLCISEEACASCENRMVWRSFLIKHQKLKDMFVSFYFVLNLFFCPIFPARQAKNALFLLYFSSKTSKESSFFLLNFSRKTSKKTHLTTSPGKTNRLNELLQIHCVRQRHRRAWSVSSPHQIFCPRSFWLSLGFATWWLLFLTFSWRLLFLNVFGNVTNSLLCVAQYAM